MNIKVIDISYAQSLVDFEKVKKSGVSAVIIRTGYLGKTDISFHSHITAAIEAGLDIGVYTYIMGNNAAETAQEAEETINRIAQYKGHINYPVFCDMEDKKYFGLRYDPKIRTDMIEAFCNTVNGAGYYPAVYINPSWLNYYTEKDRIIGKYDIWLAAWTESPFIPTRYDFGQTMWQWGSEKTDGIAGKTDSNICYIDYPALIKSKGKNFLGNNCLITAEKHIAYSETDNYIKRLEAMGFTVKTKCK